ncbi:hypothetical protein [Methylobacterium aquaticum]|uniref:hypothetical protein n=1 Tax=Methylobacterium aquaticum TaxID=270351 RepID=UPI001931758A|nr:hypothetical protein [Methylobacterium aquaticum]QRE74215.1 hypothetical protein F1D61_11895 [Methylobacterium aquaticum]
MAARRSLSWTQAMHEMAADRQPAVARRAHLASLQAAREEKLRAASGTKAGLWTVAGGFDRRRIMVHAIQSARAVLNGCLARGCWRTAMSHGLKTAWAAAHAARRAATH